jgi:hypothetical protein
VARQLAARQLHALAGQPAGAEGGFKVVASDGAVEVEDFSGQVLPPVRIVVSQSPCVPALTIRIFVSVSSVASVFSVVQSACRFSVLPSFVLRHSSFSARWPSFWA